MYRERCFWGADTLFGPYPDQRAFPSASTGATELTMLFIRVIRETHWSGGVMNWTVVWSSQSHLISTHPINGIIARRQLAKARSAAVLCGLATLYLNNASPQRYVISHCPLSRNWRATHKLFKIQHTFRVRSEFQLKWGSCVGAWWYLSSLHFYK